LPRPPQADDQEPSAINEVYWGHALTPSNLGLLPQPEAYGQWRRSCGDSLELYLRVREGVIRQARFMTEGCLATVACGSALTTMLKGLGVTQAARLSPAQLEESLGGLPPGEQHCAELAINSLRQALEDYYAKLSSPWKIIYGRK
jgi:NifU-like protein involved in Fe-S cluster formation